MRRMVCLGFRQIYEFSKMLQKFIIFMLFEGFIMIRNVVARALDHFILYINLHENVQDQTILATYNVIGLFLSLHGKL